MVTTLMMKKNSPIWTIWTKKKKSNPKKKMNELFINIYRSKIFAIDLKFHNIYNYFSSKSKFYADTLTSESLSLLKLNSIFLNIIIHS